MNQVVVSVNSQSEAVESIAGSGSESSAEADTSISNTHLADPYFAIFASKQYVAQYHYQEFTGNQLEDRSMTVAFDGADEAIRISGKTTTRLTSLWTGRRMWSIT